MSENRNVDQLEERLTAEMQNLNDRLTKMNEEMDSKFNRIGDYRKENEEKRQKLLRSRDMLLKQQQQVKDEVNCAFT